MHISNPNEFHAGQIRQVLSRGKKAIVEKTYAINRKEFESVRDYIKSGNYESSVYLHLHYIHKLPTLRLRKSVKGLVAQHGKITGISGTFFEPADDEDARRGWLFEMRNGGIFMDWVHPFEIAYYATGCSFGKIGALSIYSTNELLLGLQPDRGDGGGGSQGKALRRGGQALGAGRQGGRPEILEEVHAFRVRGRRIREARLPRIGEGVKGDKGGVRDSAGSSTANLSRTPRRCCPGRARRSSSSRR